MYSFSYLEPVCSMSSSNCCFLTCIQISQEAGQNTHSIFYLSISVSIYYNYYNSYLMSDLHLFSCRKNKSLRVRYYGKTQASFLTNPTLTPFLLRVKSISCSMAQLFAIPWTVAFQAHLSMEFSRQEYWSGRHSLLQGIFQT